MLMRSCSGAKFARKSPSIIVPLLAEALIGGSLANCWRVCSMVVSLGYAFLKSIRVLKAIGVISRSAYRAKFSNAPRMCVLVVVGSMPSLPGRAAILCSYAWIVRSASRIFICAAMAFDLPYWCLMRSLNVLFALSGGSALATLRSLVTLNELS